MALFPGFLGLSAYSIPKMIRINWYICSPMFRPLRALFLAGFILLGTSCGNEKQEDIMSEDENTTPSVEESRFNAQNVFNSLPEREYVMRLVDESKISYNADLLNDPLNAKKYSTEVFRAANLGIYGADLCIAGSFNQTQESMVFLRCVNNLAQTLGVDGAFDQQLFERVEANNSNRDSVVEIMTEAFKKVDEILKYNNRPATSAIILAACWIEGLYVSCALATEAESEEVSHAIISQKESLRQLMVMMEAVKLDADISFMRGELNKLKEEYNRPESEERSRAEKLAAITSIITPLRSRLVATGR
jgi:hypothetical protein